MTNTAYECRHDSNEKVDRKLRYWQVKQCLQNREMTAREVAEEMFKRHYTNNAERNNAAPRLTELVENGIVETCGKKEDFLTGKKVTLYRLIERYKQMSFRDFMGA